MMVWIISMMFTCILNIKQVYGPTRYFPQRGTCSGTGLLMSNIVRFVIIAGIVIVFISYIQIYRLLKSGNQHVRDQVERTDVGERVLKQRMVKITKMLFIIFTSLFACNIPFVIVAALGTKFGINLVWQRITLLILLTNCANNFFIYGVMDEEYREQLKSLIKSK